MVCCGNVRTWTELDTVVETLRNASKIGSGCGLISTQTHYPLMSRWPGLSSDTRRR
jgi:hypothetical protein